LTEHRLGQIRDVTFEILTKGRDLAEKTGTELTCVLLGHSNTGDLGKILSEYAGKVLVVDDPKLENFNSEIYKKVLGKIISERKPLMTLFGHTYFGIEFAPSLAAALNMPLATDCINVEFEDDTLTVTRQMYGGKVNVKGVLRKSESYIVTVRQATFQAKKPETPPKGEIVEIPSPLTEEIAYKRFIEYIQPSMTNGVDISSAEVLVGVGRGIKDAQNIPVVEELAKALGGALACSRPVVDKGWLPSDRQVGASAKTVRPKLYLAIGISGDFLHVVGMKNSDLIIAVNKDSKAPIFSVADYGIVEDFAKIVPPLKNRIVEMKTQKTGV
jgi:electron transfer flavoprotein alpha subunit